MSKNAKRNPGRQWLPFKEMERKPLAIPESMMAILGDHEEWRMFQNNLYAVLTRRESSGMVSEEYPGGIPLLHLSIRRMDRKVLRSWRDLQRIKTEIAGSEVEAVELFPNEDRVLDGANSYHLYCLPPGMRWMFGEWTRSIGDDETFRQELRKHGATEEQAASFGGKQEPFEWNPDDQLDQEGLVTGWHEEMRTQ